MINAVLPVEKSQSFARTEMGSNVTIQPRRPVGRSFNTFPLNPPTCHVHPACSSRIDQREHSSFMTHPLLNSWPWKQPQLQFLVTKRSVWKTQTQPSPWLQWSRYAPCCDTKCQPWPWVLGMSARTFWGWGKEKKKSRKLPPLSHVALNLPHGDKFNMLTDR